MILYYITDRLRFAGERERQRELLLAKIAEAAEAGVRYIQLCEKDLPARELQQLTQEAVRLVRHACRKGSRTRLLVHSRLDVALAAGADGVHLRSNDLTAADARAIWMSVSLHTPPVLAVSCHSVAEVRAAEAQGADFAVLSPIFGKVAVRPSTVAEMEYETRIPGIGLAVLAEACGHAPIPEHTESAPVPRVFPVLALGGVTWENAASCMAAGAAGVAGTRMLQEIDLRA